MVPCAPDFVLPTTEKDDIMFEETSTLPLYLQGDPDEGA
jgi:hypothetical protein